MTSARESLAQARTGNGSIGPWLPGIARHTLSHAARRRAVDTAARERLGMLTEAVAFGPVGSEVVDRNDPLPADLQGGLDDLTDDSSMELWLRVVDGEQCDDIAARIGTTAPAVRVRVSRAGGVAPPCLPAHRTPRRRFRKRSPMRDDLTTLGDELERAVGATIDRTAQRVADVDATSTDGPTFPARRDRRATRVTPGRSWIRHAAAAAITLVVTASALLVTGALRSGAPSAADDQDADRGGRRARSWRGRHGG